MAAGDHGGPGPDLYQLLGVPPGASRDEIAQAWRRRARAEHPDSRPGDAAPPGRVRALAGAWQGLRDPARRAGPPPARGRFRALAGAWQVLSAPARRAAYDQALSHHRPPDSVPAA